MSDGQLRMRVRAYEREQTWAPRYVGNELAASVQALDYHRDNATRWASQAEATPDPANQEQLATRARQADALAGALETQVETLRELDNERAYWYLHTVETRVAADRAQDELTNRHAGDHTHDQVVTADEWLDAHDEAMRAEDPHREITSEHDLIDHDHMADEAAHRYDHLPVVDLREITADEPAQADEDLVRVPTVDETAAAVMWAHRALDEIRARNAADAGREADEARAWQSARWHSDDRAAEAEQTAERGGPDLDLGW
jgi:hypothetical protein